MLNFSHTYTRDTSIIIQEAWFRAHTMGLGKIFDWVNPYPIPSVYVVKEGVVEIWDDGEAYQWVRDQLLHEVATQPEMLKRVIERYRDRVSMLKSICAGGCPPDAKALLRYLDVLLDAVIDFIIVYNLARDERTPVELRATAQDIREKDTLFNDHDACIRASLICIYPELEGLETVIRYREIKHQQPPNREILLARKQAWVVVPGELYEVGTKEAFVSTHTNYAFFEEHIDVKLQELKGQVAFSGAARGRVRILKRRDQVAEFQAGEILVSPMTTPDFLPAMKSAAAIVTDEGGVTSHAAIIARELGVPCLIGTKFATELFKDGDMVEVDAVQGVVRRLS